MPTYEFAYTKDRQRHVVERRFSITDCPKFITLEDGTRADLMISLNARMSHNWDSYEPSDLPPVNHPIGARQS